MDSMDVDRYLARIGIDPASVSPDLDTLERLQTAHVTTIPFETLAITGHPFGDRPGEGVSLSLPDIYEKIVDRGRGGFCYELNGLFTWLLRELGYDAERLAGRVLIDGDARPPANHHTIAVTLDRRYVVDVGLGVPQMRRPLPVDGDPRVDAIGVEWRLVESARPDADFLAKYRERNRTDRWGADDGTDADGWTDRYVVTNEPRELAYFQATCDYFTTAPESPFTGDPFVAFSTDNGYAKLSGAALTRVVDGEKREETVAESDWDDVVEREFGLRYGPSTPDAR